MRDRIGGWAILVFVAAVGGSAGVVSAQASEIDYTRWILRDVQPLPGQGVSPGFWSRDGQWLRFSVDRDPANGDLDTIYTTSASDGSGTRCVTCGLGRSFRIVGQAQSIYSESPDGRWLLAHALGAVTGGGQQAGLPCACTNFGALGQIIDTDVVALALDANGVATAAFPLTAGSAEEANLRPAFTPDGTKVIWWRNQGVRGQPPQEWKHWRILIADFAVGPDGTPRLENERVLIDRGGSLVEDGGISADGGTYYYLATVGGDPELFALDLPSGEERRLTVHLGWDEFPKPSPTGSVVYFMSDRAYANPLCDALWGASFIAGLPSDADFLVGIPGTPICAAAETRPAKRSDGSFEIRSNFDGYLMDPEGQRIVRLTRNGNAGIGSWSPDGRELSLGARAFDLPPDRIAILRFAGR